MILSRVLSISQFFFLLFIARSIGSATVEKHDSISTAQILKWHEYHKHKRLNPKNDKVTNRKDDEIDTFGKSLENPEQKNARSIKRASSTPKGNKKLNEEQKVALELFDRIPEKRRKEILSAMENFARYDAKKENDVTVKEKEEEKNSEKKFVGEEEKEERGVVADKNDELDASTAEYGTYDACDTCELCSVDDAPDDVDTTEAEKKRRRNASSSSNGSDSSSEAKIHCKKCYGCNVVLTRLEAQQDLHGKKVKMFAGASGAAVVRGYTKEHGKVIIKSWCNFGGYKQHPETASQHPLTCRDANEKYTCPIKGGIHSHGECNYKFLNALDKLAVDSNLITVVPRSWTGSVKSFLPYDGFAVQGKKIDVRAQFYEVAQGYSIEAVYGGSVSKDTLDMFKNLNQEDLMKAATFDLLFSEQDRHGQNVFITEDGRISLIDSEGCFGPTNSLLLPGGQKFEVYRIGYNAVCCGNTPLPCPQPAGEHSSPLVAFDYRCKAENQFAGFNWPKGVEAFLKKIQKMTEDDVFEIYEMTRKEHATHLKRTVDEMLNLGFEGALLKAYSRQKRGDGRTYGNDYWYPITRACCGNDVCSMRVDKSLGIVNIQKDKQGKEAESLWGSTYVHGLHVKNSPEEALKKLFELNLSSKERRPTISQSNRLRR